MPVEIAMNLYTIFEDIFNTRWVKFYLPKHRCGNYAFFWSINSILDSVLNEMKENMAIINNEVIETTTYWLIISTHGTIIKPMVH